MKNKKAIYFLYLLYFVYFVLNIIGGFPLKWLFAVITFYNFFLCFRYEVNHLPFFIFYFSWIEGQGRILWSYNPLFRSSMDIMIAVTAYRMIYRDKVIFRKKIMPSIYSYFLIFHILWWFMALFNPEGPPITSALFTLRYYILPFAVLSIALNQDLSIHSDEYKDFTRNIYILFFFQLVIMFVQFYGGYDFLYTISNHYNNPMFYSRFGGAGFRPFGTSYFPGAPTLLLTLGTIFLLLTPVKSKFLKPIFLPILLIGINFAYLISGVRSNWIKHFIILIGCNLIVFVTSKFKVKILTNIGIIIASLTILSPAIWTVVQKNTDTDTLEYKLTRSLSVLEEITREEDYTGVEKVTKVKHRASIEDFYIYLKKISFPFGNGLGTGGVNIPGVASYIKSRIDKPKGFNWTGDNFFIFITFELGLGALTFLMTIFLPPIYFMKGMVIAHTHGRTRELRILGCITVFLITSIIGAWGLSSAIIFIPELFYYWVLVGIGFKEYRKLTLDYYEDDKEPTALNTNPSSGKEAKVEKTHV